MKLSDFSARSFSSLPFYKIALDPPFIEIICKINPKLGAYMAIGTIAGGIAGFIAYIIEEKEYKTERHSSY